MVQIAPLDRSHLPQVLALVNSHLSTAIPGWSLAADYFWERLKSEPQEYITDPWVVERKSVVGIVRDRVCAAAHLLRYGDDTRYKGVGDIDWILFWPGEREVGAAVLTECRRQMNAWQVVDEQISGPFLTEGGQLPALAGWAELSEVETSETMRNQGVGSWVVQHAVEWLRLAKCDRIVLSVARDDEKAGAGRFYSRFGWMPLVRQKHWRRQEEK